MASAALMISFALMISLMMSFVYLGCGENTFYWQSSAKM
ncbi:MAG: hypothetical protein KatS3mg067_2229 [Thermosynechococcus sp.]|nr:MAG: hypothetical protein KatS3mg067_2229 [Thermosynechococcus sp.]